jgi:hypothetical protein
MPRPLARADTRERILCEGCGDVIGMYEPLVLCTAQGARVTSRAAEPGLQGSDGSLYHRDCHAKS